MIENKEDMDKMKEILKDVVNEVSFGTGRKQENIMNELTYSVKFMQRINPDITHILKELQDIMDEIKPLPDSGEMVFDLVCSFNKAITEMTIPPQFRTLYAEKYLLSSKNKIDSEKMESFKKSCKTLEESFDKNKDELKRLFGSSKKASEKGSEAP
jgi:hypothetical protein